MSFWLLKIRFLFPSFIWNGLRFLVHATLFFLVEFFRFSSRGTLRLGPPRGIFVGLDLLRSKKVQGKILFESQKLPFFPDGSLTKICLLGQEGRQPWPLFWCRLKSVYLVGPSLCPLNSEKNIMLESAYGKEFYKDDPSFNYLFLPPAERLTGPWTSFVSRWDRGYYHWLMDVLPRLICLADFPSETRCLARGKIEPYQNELIRWLGLETRFTFTEHNHFFVEDFYYSGLVGMSGCVNPWAISFLRERLWGIAKDQNGFGDNVYIYRKGKTRGLTNEEEVISFFSNLGWTVVDTEQLSVAQQAGLFRNLRQVCTSHGAALTNLLWAKPETRVLELLSDNYLNGVYEGLAKVVGCDYSFKIYPGDKRWRVRVPLEDLASWIQEAKV